MVLPSSSPGRTLVVLLLICTPIAAHPSVLVSVYVPWRLWVETRLALRLEYPRLECPSAARKGGSRHLPVDNSRRRSGCMKNAAPSFPGYVVLKFVSVESSRLSRCQSPSTSLYNPLGGPHRLANVFFAATSVSLTLGPGLLCSQLTLNPLSLRLHTLLQLRRAPRRQYRATPLPHDVADRLRHISFGARPLCTRAKSRWGVPTLGLTPVARTTA